MLTDDGEVVVGEAPGETFGSRSTITTGEAKIPAMPGDGNEVGAVFVVPLSEGRAGLCRILEVRAEPCSWRVLTGAWVGPIEAASADRAREVLRLTHHGQRGRPHVFWTLMPRPARFTRLGTMEPSAAELGLPSPAGAWEQCPLQLAAQWEWDHDREAVRARDRAESRKRSKALKAARAATTTSARARRSGAAKSEAALAKLARKRWFAEWRSGPSAKAIDDARTLVTGLAEKLAAPSRSRAQDARAIASAARAFGRLDTKHGGFIGTLEAEAIHAALMSCGEACGLDAERCERVIDEARDW
jgi:hypothetical protein